MHILMMNNAVVMYVCQGMNLSIENHLKRRHTGRKYTGDGIVLYVQEVVTLQKKYPICLHQKIRFTTLLTITIL